MSEGHTTHTIPLWEHENAAKGDAKVGQTSITNAGGARTTSTLLDMFNRLIPPHRRYLGLQRKWFLVAVATTVVVLLALIISLSAGLAQSKKS